ncbi:hypothetical protein J6590_035984 [Homalodisca vitripennis]|nr:hypothetical protein J6590_100279 [Homalodisca vitripennis]KAG8306906.1 hypothetical protein J6590_035984 [Homalodisca vitripennis]
MAQEQIIKIENALTKSLNEIDKLYTRKIQGDMHRCAAQCCDRTSDSIENVYNCIKVCSSDFDKVQRYLQAEYNQFQNRLQRCVLQCSDEIVDKMGLSPSTSDMARYNRQYETCVIACANKHIDLIPGFMRRMEEVLKKKSYLTFNVDDDDPKSFKEPTLL